MFPTLYFELSKRDISQFSSITVFEKEHMSQKHTHHQYEQDCMVNCFYKKAGIKNDY